MCRLMVTQSLQGREYIYCAGRLIYLEQLEEILYDVVERNAVPETCPTKYKLHLLEAGVSDASSARTYLDKMFCRNVVHIKNPYVRFSDFVVRVALCVLNPCSIICCVVRHTVHRIMVKDL